MSKTRSEPGSNISWKRAAGLSCLALYGPFVVMAIYALLFVSSSYCKKTAWMLLPCAPGLLPAEHARGWFHFTRPDDIIWFALSFMISASMILLLACLARRGRWLRWIGFGLALALSSIGAIGLLGLLRS